MKILIPVKRVRRRKLSLCRLDPQGLGNLAHGIGAQILTDLGCTT
jgi:hypothetical protein